MYLFLCEYLLLFFILYYAEPTAAKFHSALHCEV